MDFMARYESPSKGIMGQPGPKFSFEGSQRNHISESEEDTTKQNRKKDGFANVEGERLMTGREKG